MTKNPSQPSRVRSVSCLWEDEFEDVPPHVDEPAAAIEPDRAGVRLRHHDAERAGALEDRVPLGVLEKLAADTLRLVLGAHEELVDAEATLFLPLERYVPGGRALHLRDEDGLALEDAERVLVGAAVEARKPEEERL